MKNIICLADNILCFLFLFFVLVNIDIMLSSESIFLVGFKRHIQRCEMMLTLSKIFRIKHAITFMFILHSILSIIVGSLSAIYIKG